jgi:SAM-dependent methyltransferase
VAQGWEDVAGEFLRFVRSGDPAFEWHADAFLGLVPTDARDVLDAGCGEGRLARRLAARGHAVSGIDASPTLVRYAQEADPDGAYAVADVTSLPFGETTFDAVVSFMVLQDVERYGRAIEEAERVLRPGGAFCVALVHPLTSAGDWESDDLDSAFVVQNYCGRFALERPLADRTVTQHHRPIGDYLRTLDAAGFKLETLQELPTRRRSPGRIPVFLDLRARRDVVRSR